MNSIYFWMANAIVACVVSSHQLTDDLLSSASIDDDVMNVFDYAQEPPEYSHRLRNIKFTTPPLRTIFNTITGPRLIDNSRSDCELLDADDLVLLDILKKISIKQVTSGERLKIFKTYLMGHYNVTQQAFTVYDELVRKATLKSNDGRILKAIKSLNSSIDRGIAELSSKFNRFDGLFAKMDYVLQQSLAKQ